MGDTHQHVFFIEALKVVPGQFEGMTGQQTRAIAGALRLFLHGATPLHSGFGQFPAPIRFAILARIVIYLVFSDIFIPGLCFGLQRHRGHLEVVVGLGITSGTETAGYIYPGYDFLFRIQAAGGFEGHGRIPGNGHITDRVIRKDHAVFVFCVFIEVVDAFFSEYPVDKGQVRFPILDAVAPQMFFVEQTEFIAVGRDFAVLEDVFDNFLHLLVLENPAILLQRQ